MVVVLPTPLIDRWVQARRGIDRFDVNLPSPRWQVPAAEMTRRARALSSLLQTLTTQANDFLIGRSLSQVEERIFDVILDMIPSAEVIEPLHSRARIARAVLTFCTSGSTIRRASPSCAWPSARGSARFT